MEKKSLNDLREMYLEFFESKGHFRLESASLIPKNDKSMLLINSGMAPLKGFFTGKETPPSKRVTTCQKCVRTPDIENVGITSRHGTFFEMMGNFSFGDYFKKEAITWAWEFMTEVIKFPKDILWASIYFEDDEAYNIWNQYTDIKKERIVRLGKEDNFWEVGLGPCGPSSEIYVDRGIDKGCGKDDCKPGCDCDRFVEVWNLVFTQFDKDEDGNYNKLEHPNIDTGLGLERLACIVQDVDNMFEVDTIRSILDYISNLAGINYDNCNEKQKVSVRVIGDHVRSTVMMISDGVSPTNERRGYVLRRLIRRAVRHAKLLGIKEGFITDAALKAIEISKNAYPELLEKKEIILKVLKVEEEKFEKTLDQGMVFLDQCIEKEKEKKAYKISGKDAFTLHDELGFPIDLTKEIAKENGLLVDEKGFEIEMENQRKKSREGREDIVAWAEDVNFEDIEPTKFLGYEKFETNANVVGIIKNDEFSHICGEDEEAGLILDKTVFYAESGGQIADIGFIEIGNAKFKVLDCKKIEERYIHFGKLLNGIVKIGDSCKANIDGNRRLDIARNHTSTHLLQKALKTVVGDHVNQAGSLVESERLRFDFNHFESVSKEDLDKIEEIVNDKIFENLGVETEVMNIKDAKNKGAMALFDEKYSDNVRVVKIDDFSMELCGGTHLSNTSQIGLFKIVSEGGIASGTRRIEAISGRNALKYFKDKESLLNEVSGILKTKNNDISKKAQSIIEENKKFSKEIEIMKSKLISSSLDDMIKNIESINGVNVLTQRIDNMAMNDLRNISDNLKNKLKSGIIVIVGAFNNKVNIIVTVTKDLNSSGYHAGKLIKEIAKVTGGGGGGRPDMAQAGGKDTEKIDEALKKSLSLIKNL
jgi:alanyl-tRNA synthetase